jgi:glycosyltransferase involved in cell wall biosynthesis
MSLSANSAVVVPCLNEAHAITAVVAGARQHVSRVIVVDDGSIDDTEAKARAAGASVIRRETSGGKGRALSAGFAEADRLGFAWALAMDGDGQHSAKDIPNFLGRALVSDARLIVGNRMEDTNNMPALRRRTNQWLSRKLSRFCGFDLPDSQCGFRMVHLGSWRKLEFTSEHFEIESELLVRFVRAGFGVEFVPVQTRYGGERSKIRPLRDTIRWLKWWRAIRREFAAERSAPLLFSERPDVSGATVD